MLLKSHSLLRVMECGGSRRSRGTWQEPLQVSRGELVAWTRVWAGQVELPVTFIMKSNLAELAFRA